jgi:hypothetical protein
VVHLDDDRGAHAMELDAVPVTPPLLLLLLLLLFPPLLLPSSIRLSLRLLSLLMRLLFVRSNGERAAVAFCVRACVIVCAIAVGVADGGTAAARALALDLAVLRVDEAGVAEDLPANACVIAESDWIDG